jgi:hypothetical protein
VLSSQRRLGSRGWVAHKEFSNQEIYIEILYSLDPSLRWDDKKGRWDDKKITLR